MASLDSILNGRIRFLNRPAADPGCCSVCGAVDRPVLDFQLQIDFYGAVVICVTCIGEAYSVAELMQANNDDPNQLANLGMPLPLPIDYGAVNEYLRVTSDAISRIIAIVPDDYLLPDDTLSNDEDSTGDDDSTVPELPAESVSQSELISVERSDDGSGSIRTLDLS